LTQAGREAVTGGAKGIIGAVYHRAAVRGEGGAIKPGEFSGRYAKCAAVLLLGTGNHMSARLTQLPARVMRNRRRRVMPIPIKPMKAMTMSMD